MNDHYPHVFESLRIGPVDIPNRIYMTPHGPGFVVPDPSAPGFWLPAPNTVDYFVERARGGLGLIIQGGTIVEPSSEYPGLWQMFSEEAAGAWRPIVEAVHSHGTKMFVQIMHAGHHGDHTGQHGGPISASPLPPVEGTLLGAPYTPLLVPVKEMSLEDITRTVNAFEHASRQARSAGYDGIELHASHSYLAEQFYSPFYNKRTDRYGGSLENRLRFVFEVLEAMRRGAGSELAVGLRLGCDEMLPGGLGTDDIAEIAARLDRSGLVDFFDLDIGTYHSMDVMIAPYQLGDHWEMDSISRVRGAISTAVVLGCPGRFHDPAKAEDLVSRGALDMVGGTRGFFADPELALKAREGRASDIRPCIGLNGCLGEGGCVLNPTNGEEITFGVTKLSATPNPREVLVVGGGPAGLETARVAAMRGHQVTVLEMASQLGGALRLMSAIPGREHVIEAAEWWRLQLDDHGVKVRLAVTATVDGVMALDPDVVVVATGARFESTGLTGYIPAPIPGHDRDFVTTPEPVLTGTFPLSGRVLVLEEQPHAAIVAEYVASRGASVEILSRHPAVAEGLSAGYHRPHQVRRLDALGVTLSPSTWIRRIGDHEVDVYDVITGRTRTIADVDAVVLVTGRVGLQGLAAELESRLPEVYLIGDARHPRRMSDATRDGHRLAWTL